MKTGISGYDLRNGVAAENLNNNLLNKVLQF